MHERKDCDICHGLAPICFLSSCHVLSYSVLVRPDVPFINQFLDLSMVSTTERTLLRATWLYKSLFPSVPLLTRLSLWWPVWWPVWWPRPSLWWPVCPSDDPSVPLVTSLSLWWPVWWPVCPPGDPSVPLCATVCPGPVSPATWPTRWSPGRWVWPPSVTAEVAARPSRSRVCRRMVVAWRSVSSHQLRRYHYCGERRATAAAARY